MRRTWLALALGAALLPGSPRGLHAQDSALVRDRHKGGAVSAVQAGARGFGKPKGPAAGPLGPRRALVIGISNYKNVADLQFAAADAEAFAAFLRTPAGGSVPADNIRLRVDSAATRTRILDDVTWLQDASQSGDEAIIYFAGHGDVEAKTGKELGYLLAYDARTGRDYASEGAIKVNDLLDGIDGIVKRQAMVFLITDACRSGTMVTGQVNAPHATAALMRVWNGVATLASSGPDQLSQEGPQWGGHGVFTYYLIRGLNGHANTDGDRFVTLEEVARFVQDSVKQATDSNQVPARFGNLGRTAAWVRDPGTPVAVAGARSPGGAMAGADGEPTDSSVLRALAEFRKALNAGALLEPESASAWFAYRQLQANPAAAPVLPDVRADLRQALQEDAQQVITDYLVGGERQPEAERIRNAATELARAADLMPKTSALAPQLGARRLFLEGYAYLQKGDYASALPPLRASIALEPQAAHTYNALGFAFLASNQVDSARQAFTVARSRAPRRAYPLLGLALATLDAGEAAPALALLDSAVTISEPQASLQLVRALALLELGRRAETIAAFRRARELDPRVTDEAYLRSVLSYSPGIVARVPRLRSVVR